MLADYWVITQLLTQVFSFMFLLGAALFSTRVIRLWSADATTELQLYLERRSYLIAFMVQFVLIFQVIALFLFLHTVNNHLPGIIKGAMCATGTLGVNDYGYNVLYLKSVGIIIYAAFLILNYLDNSEPAYPLTPIKYWLVFPAFLLLSFDFYYLFEYFRNIEPDIIATCCSVSFIASKSNTVFLLEHISSNSGLLWLFYALFLILWLIQALVLVKPDLFINPKVKLGISIFQLIISLAYVFLAMLTLKYFFVKYIYGLPSHNCLFDIFWANYYYVGYGIFGSYYGLIISSLFVFLYQAFKKHLRYKHTATLKKAQLYYLFFLSLSFLIPIVYWVSWRGNL